MKQEKNNKGLKVLICLVVIVLCITILVDVLGKYVNFDEIFSNTVNYTTTKEVTVTDKGIADAVDKLYDATVIVEIESRNQVAGWGSGFVYKTDNKYGYILTNHHVVEDEETVNIVFTDESEVEGTVLGSDEYSDVAVIRIPKKNVKSVGQIGKSEDTKVGDTIFAIGTPISLSYSFTVTRGILSGTDRMVEMSNSSNSIFEKNNQESWYMNLLQIDASINSGNSGGPLANSNGEVIGLTNSKLSSGSFTSSASIENMGFAIPIEQAISVASQIEEHGKVSRPVLGVAMTTIESARYNDIDVSSKIKKGAVVVEVQSNSSASKAGLKKGDVITNIDNYEVEDYMYLKYYLYRYRVGDKVKITYYRKDKKMTTTVTLKGASD